MELRWYQQEALDKVFHYLQTQTGNPIIAQPTGTGKSVVIGKFCQTVLQNWPDRRVLMLTHVKKLIAQNYVRLQQIWPEAPCGLWSAGLKRKELDRSITFAGMQSVRKTPHELGHIDLIVIDECHLVSPNQESGYQHIINELKKINPHLRVIGLSATPYRLGQGMLTDGDIFNDICCDHTDMDTINRFIAEGVLCLLIPKETDAHYDLSGVKKNGGEYNQKQLQASMDSDVTSRAVNELVSAGVRRNRGMIFCSGIEHTEEVLGLLHLYAQDAVMVHSKMPAAKQEENLNAFLDGRVKWMVSSDQLTTGLDCPEIDIIGMLRPTSSTVLHVQMWGRGMRPHPSKENCLGLDFAENTRRLGPVNDPVKPKPPGAKKGEGTPPIRVCPECAVYNAASARTCFSCGFAFPPPTPNIVANAGNHALIAVQEMPVIEEFEVDRIEYVYHAKRGSDKTPPSMLVNYYCGVNGINRFRDFVCLEHDGYAGKKARDWWRERSGSEETPQSIADALSKIDILRAPRAIRVQTNAKYKPVLGAIYDT